MAFIDCYDSTSKMNEKDRQCRAAMKGSVLPGLVSQEVKTT